MLKEIAEKITRKNYLPSPEIELTKHESVHYRKEKLNSNTIDLLVILCISIGFTTGVVATGFMVGLNHQDSFSSIFNKFLFMGFVIIGICVVGAIFGLKIYRKRRKKLQVPYAKYFPKKNRIENSVKIKDNARNDEINRRSLEMLVLVIIFIFATISVLSLMLFVCRFKIPIIFFLLMFTYLIFIYYKEMGNKIEKHNKRIKKYYLLKKGKILRRKKE